MIFIRKFKNWVKWLWCSRQVLKTIQALANDPGVTFLSIDAPNNYVTSCHFDSRTIAKLKPMKIAGERAFVLSKTIGSDF